MTQKFLVSVGNVWGYDSNEQLLFVGKAQIDSSFETTLNNTEIRGGYGNALQTIYYHTSSVKITLNDAQWNLDWIALNAGAAVTTGTNVYQEETVTLGTAGAGTVVGTPIAITGTTLYGWVTLENGTVERVTFTGKNFTASGGSSGDVVCVRYYATNAAATQVEIPANIVPDQIRLVMDTQLISNSGTTTVIGKVEIIVPKAQASGGFTLSTKSDGVSTTPLTLTALAQTDSTTASCTAAPYYARIIEILDSTNWYDEVVGLSIQGGDFSLVHPTTHQLVVYAIPTAGSKKTAFQPPLADLTFTSGTVGTATIGAHTGLVTTVAGGTTLLTVTITSKPSVDASQTLTVTT